MRTLNEISYDEEGTDPVIVLPSLAFVVVVFVSSSYISTVIVIVRIFIPRVVFIPGIFPSVPFTIVRHGRWWW